MSVRRKLLRAAGSSHAPGRGSDNKGMQLIACRCHRRDSVQARLCLEFACSFSLIFLLACLPCFFFSRRAGVVSPAFFLDVASGLAVTVSGSELGEETSTSRTSELGTTGSVFAGTRPAQNWPEMPWPELVAAVAKRSACSLALLHPPWAV